MATEESNKTIEKQHKEFMRSFERMMETATIGMVICEIGEELAAGIVSDFVERRQDAVAKQILRVALNAWGEKAFMKKVLGFSRDNTGRN
jgi:hypothetical protein